jgi:hypothetical protein
MVRHHRPLIIPTGVVLQSDGDFDAGSIVDVRVESSDGTTREYVARATSSTTVTVLGPLTRRRKLARKVRDLLRSAHRTLTRFLPTR